MEHDWDFTTRPKNRRLHGYRFRQTPSMQAESAMDCSSDVADTDIEKGTFSSELQGDGIEGDQFHTCPPKRLRLDPSASAMPNKAYWGNSNVRGDKGVVRSRTEQYEIQKTNEIKAIKAVFKESGFLPVPNSSDMVFLTMELKRRQYCQRHGIKYNPRDQTNGNSSGIRERLDSQSQTPRTDDGPNKRHQLPSTESHDIPRKVRVLHFGIQ